MPSAILGPASREAWQEDGWCVLPAAIPPADLEAGRAALADLFPTPEEMDSGENLERTTPWRAWDATWPEFPFKSRSLNALCLHDVVLDLAEDLLGPDIRLYQGVLTAKYANQSSGYNRLLHLDYPNNSLVVPRRDAGYQQLELYLYLCDVNSANGATRLVSRRKTADIPVGRHTLNVDDYPHLYEEPGEASGPAGSIVAYRPDVYHRSMDWTEPGFARHMLHLAFKPADAEWAGYQAWPIKGLSAEWYRFVPRATPRQLIALGFPAPGHRYWTTETLEGVADRYPELDMTPWKTTRRSTE